MRLELILEKISSECYIYEVTSIFYLLDHFAKLNKKWHLFIPMFHTVWTKQYGGIISGSVLRKIIPSKYPLAYKIILLAIEYQ